MIWFDQLDMTAQLAPILWGIEIVLVMSVAWLVGAYVWNEIGHPRSVRLGGSMPEHLDSHRHEPAKTPSDASRDRELAA